eukprot:jgi/Ulvmu1/9007/UM005_0098.1
MAEAKAAKQEARKARCMKQESLASALSMPAALSSLGSTQADLMAPAASAAFQQPAGKPRAEKNHPTGDGSPSRSHPRTPDHNDEGRAGVQPAPSLQSGGTRNPNRGTKSQRFVPDTAAGLSTVPEALLGVRDESHKPGGTLAVPQRDGPAPHSSHVSESDVMVAPETPPTDVHATLGQDSHPHLEGMMLSPEASSTSLHAPVTSMAQQRTEAALASDHGVNMQRDNDSDSGTSLTPSAGLKEPETSGVSEGVKSASAVRTSPVGSFFGRFKAKAAEIVQEQRLGQIKRFASQAISDTMAKVEKCGTVAGAITCCRPTICGHSQ